MGLVYETSIRQYFPRQNPKPTDSPKFCAIQYTDMHACMYACTDTNTICMCTCTHTQRMHAAYTNTQTKHTHTHTHTHARTCTHTVS